VAARRPGSVPDPLVEPARFYRYAAGRQARGLAVMPAPLDGRVPEARHVEMLRLRLVEGLTLKEVGRRTGVSPTRVRQLLDHYFGGPGRYEHQHGHPSRVTVPTRLVGLLREALLTTFAMSAAAITDRAQQPRGFDVGLLEPFDAYRALLDAVGWAPAHPAVPVEIELRRHRWALSSTLRARLDLLDDLTAESACSESARQRTRRQARAIQAFIATAGLKDDDAHADLGRARETSA
jgi:hypothetical protein